MFRLKRVCLIFIIFAGLLLPSHPAAATVDVTTGFVSERKTTFISLYHEDASPMPVLVAGLAENVDALDNLFHRLQNAGRLLSSHPVLAIDISDDAYQRVLSGARADGYAVLSLEKDYRLDLDPHDILSPDTIGLGPVYRMELALWPVSVNELLTLVLLLPELSAGNPRMELLAADIRQYRDKFDDEIASTSWDWSNSGLLWSPDGNLLLRANWHNRGLSYQVFNVAADERMSLERLEHYILPPTFTPDSRFIVYSSQTELRIVDVKERRTTGFSLREMIPGAYQFIGHVEFAVNKTGDTLFFHPWGWGMPLPSPNFLWRSANREQLEKISGLGVMEKPDLPGEAWSDLMHRRHASIVKTPAELAELKEELTAPINVELAATHERLISKYGEVYGETINYPRNDHLAVLIGGEDRLEARVLSLPSLKEIDTHLFTLVPPKPQPHIPGTIAGISLFNMIVMTLLLLMAVGITVLILFVKQKYGRQPTASISKKKKLLFFTGAFLITLLLHFAATIYLTEIVDDNMGERAGSIAEQAIKQRYVGLGHTVEFTGGAFKAMIGSSPLWPIDFPYQVLYWQLSGFTRFAAPMEVGINYKVFDQQGNFIKGEAVRYYVLGVNRLVQSHVPWM
ncbi:MAG: hypothetical protein M1571_07100 [Firmicutes bacterium]|nr:hypothetical protein [Bacillota bacterium]